jgi:hypothetical protein
MNETLYYIMLNDQKAGPYTVGQLRSMWHSGAVTAQTQYWFEGAKAWMSLIKLRNILEPAAIQPVISVVASQPTRLAPQRMPASSHHVRHTGQVTTKARGSGLVALGSIMCFVGVFLAFTPIGGVGGTLLFVGFFVAVIGRMMS